VESWLCFAGATSSLISQVDETHYRPIHFSITTEVRPRRYRLARLRHRRKATTTNGIESTKQGKIFDDDMTRRHTIALDATTVETHNLPDVSTREISTVSPKSCARVPQGLNKKCSDFSDSTRKCTGLLRPPNFPTLLQTFQTLHKHVPSFHGPPTFPLAFHS